MGYFIIKVRQCQCPRLSSCKVRNQQNLNRYQQALQTIKFGDQLTKIITV
jgi:hypothetical protein